MSELKTKERKASVAAFINKIASEKRREEAKKLVTIFEGVTKEKAKMWGPSIIGFGKYSYTRKGSKKEYEFMLTGFSPRKDKHSLYIMSGFKGVEDYLKDLGTYKRTSGCCLYVKKLEDIHIPTLKKLIRKSYSLTKQHKIEYGS